MDRGIHDRSYPNVTRKKKRSNAAPPRARKSHGRQRQRLIDACISALHLYGPSRTTVEKVVAIAKMSPGIVRFYFDSKAAMMVASLQFLAAEFEEQVLVPVAKLKSQPVAALQLLVELYLDAEIASARKVSVWYAFWGEASSRQEYYDICGKKDQSFAILVRELVEKLIAESAHRHLDAEGVTLGLIGALEILWQDFAFQTERDIDRPAAKSRCMAYLRSVFPGQFTPVMNVESSGLAAGPLPVTFAGWVYGNERIFALERERLFQPAWIVVGHEAQIAHPGAFLTADIGEERVLLVRNGAGALQALRNSCPESPHSLVAADSGQFESIECQQHRLRFSLSGVRLQGGRSTGTGRADLSALETRVVGGLIFVKSPRANRALGAQAMSDPTPALDGWFSNFGAQALVMLGPPLDIAVTADWKVLVEGWLATSVGDLGIGMTPDFLEWNAQPLGRGWSGARYSKLLQCQPERTFRRRFLAPNQLLEARPDGLAVVQALPLAPGRCRLRRLDYSVLSPDHAARAAQYLARRLGPYARRITLALAESVQKGMIQFGYEAQGGSLVSAVGWFRRELAARIPAVAEERPPID
jgi:TetR/AcrR family transcriptional regulator, transcriptional repressor of bet genes